MVKLVIRENGAEIGELNLVENREFIVGRGKDADFVLKEHASISRKHFGIVNGGDKIRVMVYSRYGLDYEGRKVADIDLSVGSKFSLPPYEFNIEQKKVEIPASVPVTTDGNLAHQAEAATPDEATFVAAAEHAAFLKVRDVGAAMPTEFALRGTKWLAGRDPACDVVLEDPRVSRKQFEIEKTSVGYFLRDIGSSNGTYLNNERLRNFETAPLQSGDIIQVQTLEIAFELRDPGFQRRLQVVPADLMNSPDLAGIVVGTEKSDGDGGAVAIRSGGSPLQQIAKNVDTKSTGFKVGATLVALLIVMTAVFWPESKSNRNKANCGKLCTLSAQQRQMIKDTYALAQNLFLQKKFETASQQLQKIHEILPEGYENSLKMAQDCADAYKIQQTQEEIAKEQERLAQNQKIVNQILAKCAPISQRSDNLEEIRSCLAPAVEFDPENPQAAQMLLMVTSRAENKRLQAERQADYRKRAALGDSMYSKAQVLEKQGDLLAAIDTYQAYIASNYPDPKGLKADASKKVIELRNIIGQKVAEHIEAAQKYMEQSNFREALESIQQGKKIDPKNEQLFQLGVKALNELTAQLQAIYSDSVLDEGLGNLESAKEKWKKILELDRVDGDYYRRAKNKLRQYGSPQ